MPLPEPELYTIKNLAQRWGESEEDVLVRVRTGQFKHLIVYTSGELGAFTKHYYIDYERASILGGDTPAPIVYTEPGHAARLRKREMGYYIHSMEEFPWPGRESTLYIPRTEVKAFEKEHRIRPIRGSKTLKPAGIATQVESDTMPAPTGIAWQDIARKIAIDIAKKHKHLNQERIAERVYHEMFKMSSIKDDARVRGRSGKVPSAGTIKRWALKGLRGAEQQKKPWKPRGW